MKRLIGERRSIADTAQGTSDKCGRDVGSDIYNKDEYKRNAATDQRTEV